MARRNKTLSDLLTGRGGYSSATLPSMGELTGNYNPGVYQPSIEYIPSQVNSGILERSLAKIEDRKEKTQAQRAYIQKVLDSFDLNEADDEFKIQKTNEILNSIDAAAQSGNLSDALNVASTIAGDIVNDRELRAKERNNKKYQQDKAIVFNNKNLSDITKRRWLEQNQYNNDNLYDENGKFVGGSEWQSNWMPVNPLDKLKFYNDLKQIVAPEISNTDNILYVDAEGNITKDISKGVYGMAIKTKTGIQRISAEKYKEAFDRLWKQYPEAEQALKQEYMDVVYEANKLNEKLKTESPESPEYQADKIHYDSLLDQVTDREGKYIGQEQYLKNTVYPVLDKMDYSNVTVEHSSGDGYVNYHKAMASAVTNKAAVRGLYSFNDVGEGPIVEEVMLDGYNAATTAYEGAYNELAKLLPFVNRSTSQFNKYIKNCKKMEAIKYLRDYLNRSSFGLDPIQRKRAIDALNVMEDNTYTLNNLTAPLESDKKEAIAFNSSFESMLTLPNKEKNRYTKQLLEEEDRIFGDSDTIDIKIQWSDDDNRYLRALEQVGLKPADVEHYGVETITEDDNHYIRINKNSKYARLLLKGFAQTNDDFWHMPGNSSHIYRVDKNGNRDMVAMPSTRKHPITLMPIGPNNLTDVLSHYNYIISSANSNAITGAKQAGHLHANTPVILYGTKGAADADLFNMVLSQNVDITTYKTLASENEERKNRLIVGQSLQNFKVYWDAHEGQTLREATNEERGYVDKYLAECRDNNRKFDWQYGSKDGVAGVYINVGAKLDKNGNAMTGSNAYAGFRVFVPGLLKDDAERALAANTKTRTVQLLANLQRTKGQYTLTDGTVINNIINTGNGTKAMKNGEEASYEEVKADILNDLNIKGIQPYFVAAYNPNATEGNISQFESHLYGIISDVYGDIDINSNDYKLLKAAYIKKIAQSLGINLNN